MVTLNAPCDAGRDARSFASRRVTMRDRAAIDQVCHARNVNESAYFNQRHHGVLQSEAFRFEFPCTARGRDIMRRTENDAYFRKWARQNESVPAFRPPGARILQVRGKK